MSNEPEDQIRVEVDNYCPGCGQFEVVSILIPVDQQAPVQVQYFCDWCKTHKDVRSH